MENSPQKGSNFRNKKINLLVLLIFIGFITSLAFHIYLSNIFIDRYPYNTFLFRPWDRFSDYINWFNYSNNLNPYLSVEPTVMLNMFPFIVFIGYLTNFIGLYPFMVIFFVFFIVFFFLITYQNIKSGSILIDIRNVIITTFFSYPFLFAIDRGNLEILVFIVLYLFIHFFIQKKYYISAFFLSIAVAIKIVPVMLILLFISEKKYRSAFYSFIQAILLNIIPLLIYQGGIINNIKRLLENLTLYQRIYAFTNEGLAFGHSLWGLLKIISSGTMSRGIIDWNILLNIYFITSIILIFFIIFYVLVIEKAFWKKVTIIVFSMNLLPFISGDYRLLHVFIPLFLYIKNSNKSKLDYWYLILFALILVPKNYYYFKITDVSLSVVLNPIFLLLMLIFITFEGFKNYQLKTN